MPGLLRGVARTAVVAGTATAVSNRVSRRQANRWTAQAPPQAQAPEPQYAPPPPAPTTTTPDLIEALTKLGELHTNGVLTDEEFAVQKARLLG